MEQNATVLGDEQIIAGLLSGKSISVLSKELEVSRATIHRRLEDPDFSAELSRCRQELIDSIVDSVSSASVKAVECLVSLLKDESATVRLGAAKALLDPVLRKHAGQTIHHSGGISVSHGLAQLAVMDEDLCNDILESLEKAVGKANGEGHSEATA